MKYCYLSEKGKREHNEDSVFIPHSSEVALAAVADGMGGHRAGSIASSVALENLVACVKKGGPETPEKLLETALDAANSAVYEMSRSHDEYRGMGTTVVAVMPFKSRYIAANIGDSRLYHFHNGKLRQITKDHSYVEELVEAGYITISQASVHPRRNIITRAVGTSKKETADIYLQSWDPGDLLILCTDGLHSALPVPEMERILREESDLDAACKRLVENALFCGSADNISVVLILNEVK